MPDTVNTSFDVPTPMNVHYGGRLLATNTNKIALGTSIIDVLFHNPVVLARRFATLDILSEGRDMAG